MALASRRGSTSGETGPDLPRGIGALQDHWRELPPMLTADQVLEAGWLGITRAPLYRAIARGELPAVRLGRRVFLLTKPLVHLLLGVDLDDPAVCVTGGQASSQSCSPPHVHDVNGREAP